MSLNDILNKIPNETIDAGDVEKWTEPSLYPPPPPAGKYDFVVEDLADADVFENAGGKFLSAQVNLSVSGGEFDGKAVNYIRVDTMKRKDGGSVFLDFCKSAGVSDKEIKSATSAADMAELLSEIAESKTIVHGHLDWRAFSADAYNQKLVELTGAGSPETAKKVATREQRKEAAQFATVCKGYRDFPDNEAGDGKKAAVIGPLGETVRAQAYVRAFVLQ